MSRLRPIALVMTLLVVSGCGDDGNSSQDRDASLPDADAGTDAGIDAGIDAGMSDAGDDADAAVDAAVDAGEDAGPADHDGDGVADADDACPRGATGWTSETSTDHDGDGCRDASEDDEDDNDGVADGEDGCPRGDTGWISSASTDLDGDGCRDATEDDDDDGDGYEAGVDCDDTDADVNPAATEVCDGIDNDCDTNSDENLTTTYFADDDGDGFGDAASTVEACSAPADYTTDSTDCDDTDATIFPGAPETCIEKDCNAATVPACDPVTFAHVHPIYLSYCSGCHGGGNSGGHNIAHADIATAYASSQQAAYSVTGTKGAATLVRIQSGQMPQGAGCTGDPTLDQGNASCLTAAEQALIQQWLDDGQLGP